MSTVSPAESEASDSKLEGRVLLGRYRVERVLGEGGMGAVYLARHELIDKGVVIKVLHEDMARDQDVVERFRREAKAATAIGNEHIVDVTDMGELDDGSPFIVMELLEGRPLADAIEEDGAFPVARTVHVAMQICDALAAAHEKGIVHRDLKPENIFLVERRKDADFVKVLDFGISKMQKSPAEEGNLTRTGMAMGTPTYMSPEQAQGLKTLDHRTDVYALGVILYEMLAGDLPFLAETYPALLLKMMTEDAPPLTEKRGDVPPGLAELVQRTMAKKPEDRPATMRELAEALAPYAELDLDPVLLDGASGGAGEFVSGVQETMAASPAVKRREKETEPQGAHDPGDVAMAPTERPPAPELEPELAVEEPSAAASPSSAGRAPLLVAVGLLVVGAIGGLVAWQVSSAPEPETPEIEAPTPEPSAAEVRVRIRVTPSDAHIFLGDVEYPNPMDAQRPRTLDPQPLRIEREGYRTLERVVVLDQDRSYDFELAEEAGTATMEEAAPEEAAPTSPRARPSERRGEGRSRPAAAEATPPPRESPPPREAPATRPPAQAETRTETRPGQTTTDDGIYQGRRGNLRDDF
ncbi:MAG: protein kinase [Myxococcota bacterium]|nr:protein kinase [Myxococcota bacterium]